jgi:A/G-specific adenine glycosylase
VQKRKLSNCSPSSQCRRAWPAIQPEQLVADLVSWFERGARDLPWRKTSDPYAIWISEIMLQQTQVKTVVPYWERWMKAFPTVQRLACAPLSHILKLWEGLGYYSRARHLQAAAQKIIAQHNGQFPRSFEAILDLPGIGRYTAGAICSIAFNEPRPILDGNVIRVLTRIYGMRTHPKLNRTQTRLWSIAERLVKTSAQVYPAKGPRLFNQALMELGALCCTPRDPQCARCPARSICRAALLGKVERIPARAPRPPVTEHNVFAFVCAHNGHVLVRQRPAGGLNAHLWEFPNFDVATGSRRDPSPLPVSGRKRCSAILCHSDGPCPREVAQQLLGFKPQHVEALCAFRHVITHHRITLTAFRLELPGRDRLLAGVGEWTPIDRLGTLPFSSAHRRIALELTAQNKTVR